MTDPLRSRDFRLLLVCRTLSQLGDAAVPAALALAVLRATGSTSDLALILACAMAPRVLLLPVGGAVADRFQARRVAIAADVVRTAVQLFAGFQLIGDAPQLWLIAVTQVAGGAATAFAAPTNSPLVAGIVPSEGLLKANSALGVARGATQLAGPAVAGLFMTTAGPGWTFAFDAATFAVSAAILGLIRIAPVAVPRRSFRADLVEGWTHVRSADWYWSSLIAHLVWNGAAATLLTLGPAIAIAHLGGESAWIIVLEAGALGLVAGSVLAARIRPRRPVLLANLALATYGLPLILLAAAAPVALVAAGYAIALAAMGLLNSIWATAVQKRFPAHVLARVTSYDWLVSFASVPLGFLVAPLAADAFGPDVPLTTAAVLVTVVCLGTALVPGVRRFTDVRADTPAGVAS